MALEASPAINRLLLILIGEMLLQANEDLAHGSHRPFRELAAGLREFSLHMAATVDGVGGALPPEVGRRYVKAMELFTGRGGVSHLDDFIRQLDLIADGRIKTSAHIVESKWQIIAEVARLMIELLVAMVISAFSAGGSAGQMALAMARSRVFVLSVMDNLLRRVHLMPTLSEAIDEAFQSFVVRLALILKGPKGQRPDGFDWGNILQDGLFGGLAG
ncbi:hypothetical protein, partial [Streptomyces tendae]|uniref:hypothetical protein n=1 Tax=Streptomyces tendae TaxID=1932 RepID=UPI003D74DCFD